MYSSPVTLYHKTVYLKNCTFYFHIQLPALYFHVQPKITATGESLFRIQMPMRSCNNETKQNDTKERAVTLMYSVLSCLYLRNNSLFISMTVKNLNFIEQNIPSRVKQEESEDDLNLTWESVIP